MTQESFPQGSVQDAAIFYLQHGFAPVPVPYREKGAKLDDWPKLRMQPADVARHFPTNRASNIGLILHDDCRLVDIDLDCDEAVQAGNRWLPSTPWISGRAGSRRSHHWYLVRQPVEHLNFDDLGGGDRRRRLLELRAGNGNQTVVPPGVHEIGDNIVWEAISDLPANIDAADIIQAAGEVGSLSLLTRHWPRTSGQRHDMHLALAGGLLRGGWDVEKTERFIELLAEMTGDEEGRKRAKGVGPTAAKLANGQNVSGWPSLAKLLGANGNVIVQKVRAWIVGRHSEPSGRPSPQAPQPPKPKPALPYRPFPVHLLPSPLDAFVTEGSAAIGCDPAYVALPTLAVVASCIGNTRTIRLKGGWEEPSVIWSVIVGDSGTTKTPAFKLAVKHLYAVQDRLRKEHAAAEEIYKVAFAQWEDDDPMTRGEPPPKPRQEKAVYADATIEKVAEILEDSPRGSLLARDELASWFGSFGRYKAKGGGTDLPNWLEMSSAGTISIDRKTGNRPSIYVRRAATSITGSIQPGVMSRSMTGEFVDAGLPARLLMAMPPRRPKVWTEQEVDPATQAKYHRLLDRLRELEFARDEEGELAPVAIRLSHEAKQVWIKYVNDWGREQAAVEGELAAAYSKLEAFSARFALLHHVVTHVAAVTDDRQPVDVESVEVGIGLSRWFAAEARRLYDMFAESEDERDLRKLVDFISSRGGRITARELMRSNQRRYGSAEAVDHALSRLVDAGLARWFEVETTRKGGGPVKAIELVEPDPDDPDDEADDDSGDGGDPPSDPGPPPSSTTCDSDDSDPADPITVINVTRHTQVESENEPSPWRLRASGQCHTSFDRPEGIVTLEERGLDGCCCHTADKPVWPINDDERTDLSGRETASGRPIPRNPAGSGVTVITVTHPQGAKIASTIDHSEARLGDQIGEATVARPKGSKSPIELCVTCDNDDSDPPKPQLGIAALGDNACDSQGNDEFDLDDGLPPFPIIVTQTTARTTSRKDGSYLLLDQPDDLPVVVAAVRESTLVGLDCETTGLNPRTDRLRLIALDCDTNDGGRFSYVVDVSKVDPAPLWPALADVDVVVHNGIFDLGFLARLGFAPGRVHDTRLMSQVLYASAHIKGKLPTRHGLKDCCQRELQIELSKDLQASDWAGPLMPDQLEYAARDAAVLIPLQRALTQKLNEARLADAAAIEARALPCVVWMANAGVPLEKEVWSRLATEAAGDAERLRRELDDLAPPKPDGLFNGTWNWGSPDQAKQALALAGCDLEATRDDLLAAVDHPLAALLRDHREASKRASTYGDAWLKHVAADGRVYPSWSQLGANSGRMACGSPNMQNLPRGPYRKCVAAPTGRVLVKADYSQIELRIAAKVSGDKALLTAYQRGDDLHTLTAKNVLGASEVTREARQLAKAVNFGLLYGMGANTFRSYALTNYGVRLTEAEATSYREAFFRTYPGLRRWHRSMGKQPIATRTLTKRRVLGVDRFTEKLNLPVQGTGADGLKIALAMIWERRHECPTAVPVLAVHDEIVLECPEADGATVAEWLKRLMIEAMAPLVAPIPVEVEVRVARTWGGH